MNTGHYSGLGKKVKVKSGYKYSQYYPWDNWTINKEGICASAVSDGQMCVQFDDGSQDWFPEEEVTFLE